MEEKEGRREIGEIKIIHRREKERKGNEGKEKTRKGREKGWKMKASWGRKRREEKKN